MLIGLMGKAGAGKDTLAAQLAPLGFTRVAFADALYEEVAADYGVTVDLLRERKDEYVEALRDTPREILQNRGVLRRTINTDYWVFIAEEKLTALRDTGTSVVVTDVRFPNEYRAIVKAGGILVRVIRDAGHLRLRGTAAEHISETALDGYVADAVVENREENPADMLRQLMTNPQGFFSRGAA